MLSNNIFIEVNVQKIKKILTIIIILNILIYFIYGLVFRSEVYAAQTKESVSSKLNNYPGYAELINKLRAAHPNWNFTIFYTGLDWNQVIKNETTAWHGRNLVTSSKTGDWICPTCNDKKYDNGSWRCASEATVSYYMDPRNFLNDDSIFQFEQAVFNSSIHSVDGVMSMTSGSFLEGRTNAEAIIEACRNVNINPYQVVSRILQEQGKTGSTMSRGNEGYYNVFNVGASGSSSSQIIANATAYAKSQGWNTLAKSIVGGIDFLKSKYIGIGQNTLYLQKFDVDNSDGSLYYHQYMQNVSAALTESYTVRDVYQRMGTFNNSVSFLIPVYENMPQEKCPIPGTQGIVTQNVKIKGSNVNIRESKNTSSNILATLNTGDILLRIEVANVAENGYYWDKVVLSDGRKGYVANAYIEKIDDITNCNDSVIANTSVNLRNGPGTNNTSIITTLTKGQALTRIETGKYNGLDGYNWDRVKLSDGRQGYLVSSYIDVAGNSNSGGNSTNELVKVICGSGLKVRESPGTDQRVVTYLNKGDIVTRVEKNSSNANGYVWDKIVTGTGVTGYIARGDSKESYIEVVSDNNNGDGGNNVDTGKNNNFKVEGTNVITEPNTTAEKIKEKYSNAVIKKDGQEIKSGLVGTGYIVAIDGKSYTIVKKGDVDGDGAIDIIDMALMKRHLIGTQSLSGFYKQAGQISSSSSDIDIVDLALMKRHLIGSQNITL